MMLRPLFVTDHGASLPVAITVLLMVFAFSCNTGDGGTINLSKQTAALPIVWRDIAAVSSLCAMPLAWLLSEFVTRRNRNSRLLDHSWNRPPKAASIICRHHRHDLRLHPDPARPMLDTCHLAAVPRTTEFDSACLHQPRQPPPEVIPGTPLPSEVLEDL